MRYVLDRILRAGIKLCFLTGVSFMVTACYAPYYEEPDNENYQKDMQQMEQQIQSSHDKQ